MEFSFNIRVCKLLLTITIDLFDIDLSDGSLGFSVVVNWR